MKNNKFLRGSEWRRWDLHFHTKGTNKNDLFTSADFDTYDQIDAIIDKDINILGFRDKFARAVLNIVDNAVKYTPDGKKVDISLEMVNKQALIAIKDQGPGIKKVEISHIFDRFYRGTKTQKIIGSGLGLSISKAIIALHNGEIKVKSSPGHGSTFAIVVPIAPSS